MNAQRIIGGGFVRTACRELVNCDDDANDNDNGRATTRPGCGGLPERASAMHVPMRVPFRDSDQAGVPCLVRPH